MSKASSTPWSTESGPDDRGLSRRKFIGYVLAGSTLVAAAEIGLLSRPAGAAVPTSAVPADLYDLSDAQRDAATPTANLVTVTVKSDGTASYQLPRAAGGQGIPTAVAM